MAVGHLRQRRCQGGEECVAIDMVFAARVSDIVEPRDWTSDTAQFEVQKNANSPGPAAHDVIDEQMRLDSHRPLRRWGGIIGAYFGWLFAQAQTNRARPGVRLFRACRPRRQVSSAILSQ